MEELKYENTQKRGENDPRRSTTIREGMFRINQESWKTRNRRITTPNHEAHGGHAKNVELEKKFYSFTGSTLTTTPLSIISAVHSICSPCSKDNNFTIAEGITVVIEPLLNLIFVLNVIFIYPPIIFLINILTRTPLIYLTIFPIKNPKGLYIRTILITYRKSLGISQRAGYEPCHEGLFLFLEIPRFPLIHTEGNIKRETRCIRMNGRKVVFDKKPGQVGWVEQDIVDKCVAESLQGLDLKLGIRRTCPIKGGA